MSSKVFTGWLGCVLILGSTAALADGQNQAAPTSKPCASLSGYYKGTCVNHWADGDYTFAASAKIWQLPGAAGGPGGMPGAVEGRASGPGCGALQLTMWTTEPTGAVDFLENRSFTIDASTGVSATETDSTGSTVTTIEGLWSGDLSQFTILESTQGKEDDGVTPYSTNYSTALSKTGTQLTLKKTGTGSYVTPEDCTFSAQ